VNGANADLEGTAGTAAFGLWLALGIGYHTLLEWQFRRARTAGPRPRRS
jgi:hypothetical protein